MTKRRRCYKTGFEDGFELCKKEIMDVIEQAVQDYNKDITLYPKNSKFLELELDAIVELRDKIEIDISFVTRKLK